jgi:hypothetical protein
VGKIERLDFMTVWGDKSQSPINCVPDSGMELEGGAVVDGAQVDIEGVDGGFKDDFSTDLSKYLTANGVFIENGVLKFDNTYSGTPVLLWDSSPITGSVLNCIKKSVFEIKAKIVSAPAATNHFVILATRYTATNVYGLRVQFDANGAISCNGVSISDLGVSVGNIFSFVARETGPFGTGVGSGFYDIFVKVNGVEHKIGSNVGYARLGFGWLYNGNCDCLEVQEFNVYGYPQKSVATVPKSDPFKPLLPANLAILGAITPILLGEKKPNTAVYLEGQIYNDDLLFQLQQINPDAVKDDAWSSLDGKIGEWTRIAELENGVPVLPPEMLKGLDGEFRPQIVFETDGVNQPQSFAGFSMVWGSDVLAPDAPTIISIAQDGAGAVVLKIVDVFPDDAVAAELEVNINNQGYKRVDVSNALSLDSDYMRFIGSTANVQKAGQVNANCHTISGLSLSDTVKFKARYIDAVGNASAFIESQLITITEAQFEPIFLEDIEEFWEDNDDWQEDWE